MSYDDWKQDEPVSYYHEEPPSVCFRCYGRYRTPTGPYCEPCARTIDAQLAAGFNPYTKEEDSMGLTARSSGGGDFTPAPAGSHAARCCWVIDLGVQKGGNYGAKHKALLGWELPEELMTEGDRAGEPFFISCFYTVSLSEKANLRHDLESWRGRSFTEKELEGFNLRNVLGAPCLLTVSHITKDGQTKARVAGVSPLPKSMHCPDRINPLRCFDLDAPDWDVYRSLPEWVQKMIDGRVEESAGGTSAASSSDGSEEPCPF